MNTPTIRYRLRALIEKYDSSKMPPSGGPISTSPIASEDIYLQIHLKAAIEALWSSSKGDWEQLLKCLENELSEVVSE